MSKRTIEVFSAGCPVCERTVEMVRSMACPSCDLQILDLRTGAAQARAGTLGVQRIPAVAVNGELADCCRGGVDAERLRSLGVGVRA